MELDIFAHSQNAAGQRHLLSQHLHRVADLAALFAEPLEASELARVAGLLHDIGKIHQAFQTYLLAVEQDPTLKGQGPGHKGAGAVHANTLGLDFLAFLIAGHHGGLPEWGNLRTWIREQAEQIDVQESIRQAITVFPSIASFSGTLPNHLRTPYDHELFIRLLFSTLVDADFLDTEHHFIASRSHIRQNPSQRADRWQYLWNQFERDLQLQPGPDTSSLNRRRHEVLKYCCQAAPQKPGFFRLTVPTGGGKTRSSLAFALLHAQEHSLQRIVYAIPYMSITEQTADVFRSIFSESSVVLEHHSGIAVPDNPHAATQEQTWNRLAAENWDAPLIVTTTVQLLESLLACMPSSCRKLHNLVGSVIILDETQMLPTHLLDTILEVLQQLVIHYHTTVVLCTATQPALDDRAGFSGLRDVREMIPSPERYFTALARVQYHWPRLGERWSWEDVARRIRPEEQVLTIVNTRADALTLLQHLSDIDVCHLSTTLCGAHRRVVLQEVRDRLKAGTPCRLIATQLIEAGVDVDFPLVLRALGPFDSIAQAAGRCNREGRLAHGTVIVFEPEEGHLPPGPYRVGTATTKGLLAEGPLDSTDLSLYRRYFERYYRRVNRDEPQVQEARQQLNYPEVAKRFRMIDEDTISVVVLYQHPKHPGQVDTLLNDIQQPSADRRALLRQLQPFLVQIRTSAFERARQQKLPHPIVQEVLPDLWVWHGQYDAVFGLVLPRNGSTPEQHASL